MKLQSNFTYLSKKGSWCKALKGDKNYELIKNY